MKKGFTLIELLSVIIILAIILVVAVPKIMDKIEDVRLQSYISNEKILVKAATTYLVVNPNLAPQNIGSTAEIKLSDLKSNNLISKIIDPNDKNVECNGYVLVTKIEEGVYDYTPYLKCRNSLITDGYINDKLVGYWKLDNNAFDYGPNNNQGILYGTTSGENRFNINNSALNFNGSSYVNLGNNSSLDFGTSDFTIGLWIYRTSNGFQGGSYIVKSNGSGATGFDCYDNNLYVTTNTGRLASIAFISTLNIWEHHVFVVTQLNSPYIKHYINGNLNQTGYVESGNKGSINNAKNLILGVSDAGGINRYFNGKLDDLYIYGRALSADEIKYNYNIEKTTSR